MGTRRRSFGRTPLSDRFKFYAKMSGDNSSVASGSSYPALDATSPTDSVIAGDFGSLSAQEQERQRDEWKAELSKTEEEIITLRQVLASKEAHAQGLKRRLGITAWREFSEDMTQGLKNFKTVKPTRKQVKPLPPPRPKVRQYGLRFQIPRVSFQPAQKWALHSEQPNPK